MLLIPGSLFFSACQSETILDPGPCDFSTEIEAYKLVWADEFEGAVLDTSSWTYEIGDGCDRDICGWGNNELQYYTDRRSNARVDNGTLIIRALKEAVPYEGYDYTSARLVTKNKQDFRFGRMDVRAKLPKGQGLWSAIWMLPTENKFGGWPKSGEIDIMELVGNRPNEVFSTIHYGHDFWRYTSTPTYTLGEGDFSQDYNVFSLLWREDCMQFMVNDSIYGSLTPSTTLPTGYPFNEAFHMILNVAVGGNLPGNPDGNTVFPQSMEVDYVRVYEEI
jgi:beta-glucanase (GH16 family)